jgi:hypothetical protein
MHSAHISPHLGASFLLPEVCIAFMIASYMIRSLIGVMQMRSICLEHQIQ